jgi:hypothetical protein
MMRVPGAPPVQQRAHLTPEPHETRTRLLPNRRPAADDERIVALLESPPALLKAGDRYVRAGIANDHGEVYREVIMLNLLQMLELAAKLNTLRYTLDRTFRDGHGSRYAAVFSRRTISGDGASE